MPNYRSMKRRKTKCEATRQRRLALFCQRALLFLSLCVVPFATPERVPELSSTYLQMHRLYLQQPPHDRALYDVLHISPNATAADITKAYRRLSRRYHPDKTKNDSSSEMMLERVQQAYEILKDDATRLPYHRYGLFDTSQAVWVLTGRGQKRRKNQDDERMGKLLRLMGYHYCQGANEQDDTTLLERERMVAVDLLEKIRPVVEGRISRQALLQAVAADADLLKSLPLGAQIVRCVGRAYKHAGQRFLREQARNQRHEVVVTIPESVRDGLRQGKLLLTAAGWWGRALWNENLAARSNSNKKKSSETITYHGWTDNFGELTHHDDEVLEHRPPTHDEIKDRERRKAQKAILESVQVEALWKICKIDLYRVVRQACDLIFSGQEFFYCHLVSADGWVGSAGRTIATEVGLRRAAVVLKAMGDIMVERSKEGTAWME